MIIHIFDFINFDIGIYTVRKFCKPALKIINYYHLEKQILHNNEEKKKKEMGKYIFSVHIYYYICYLF